jgi:hypothetical protein
VHGMCITHGEVRNACKILVGTPGRRRCRWNDFKMDLKEDVRLGSSRGHGNETSGSMKGEELVD